MTVGDMKVIINDLNDDVEIEINSVWNEDANELTSVSCSGFYHDSKKKVFLTPDVIAL